MGALQALFAVLLLAFAPIDALAQSPSNTVHHHRPSARGKVTIEIGVVHATNENSRIDPKLRSIAPHLKFIPYSGFSMLNRHQAELGLDQQQAFTIAGGRKVRVKLMERTEAHAKVRVSMFNGDRKLLDTTVRIHRNKSFIVAGPKYKGGVLILPITARY